MTFSSRILPHIFAALLLTSIAKAIPIPFDVINSAVSSVPVLSTQVGSAVSVQKLSGVASHALNSEGNKPSEEKNADVGEEELLEAFMDLEALEKILEVETKYIENRKEDDSSWPVTLSAKVSSKHASTEEKDLLNQDLQHAISAIIVMKMMEERLSFINQYAQEAMSDHWNVKVDTLLGADKASTIRGLFELKYLEGVLHSINTMIEASLTDIDVYSPVSPKLVNPGTSIVPLSPHSTTTPGDDITIGIGAFVVLVFTAIGFFFVLFSIIYILLKMVRRCFESSTISQKRSKYEQI